MRHDAFVLLGVLVFILLLSMVTLSLLFRTQADETGASAGAASEQAWQAALSGIDEAIRVAVASAPGSTDWLDMPAIFKDRLIADDGANRWYFTVYSTGESDSQKEIRYGLTDEASRIHLNHPGAAALTRVPRMSPELSRAFMAFDPSKAPAKMDDVSANAFADTLAPSTGAEITTGATSNPLSSNTFVGRDRFAEVDDLLRVPGFSWPLVFGEDANLNGRLDPNENDGDAMFPPDNQDSQLDRGMGQYFTTVSYEPRRHRRGRDRVNLNDSRDPLPSIPLPPAFTNYVAALRASNTKLRHPVDALDATLQIKDDQGREISIASGITPDDLPWLLEHFHADEPVSHPGLININTAGAIVLATLPGMDFSLAESAVSTRSSLGPERRTSIAWLLRENLLDVPKFKALAPHITTGSHQFRFRVVGFGVPSGAFRVLEVTIDVADGGHRVIRLRDLTRAGAPFRLAAGGPDGAISKDPPSMP